MDIEIQTGQLAGSWINTERDAKVPHIAEHLALLHEGAITRAMHNYLKTDVKIEIEPDVYAYYPSPATAWQRDPVFRRWAIETADAMYTHNMRTLGRFNIIGYLNWVTNYDHGYM
ncbi:MAG: hypothetical protein AAGK74_21165, partial [Chloroflexota bacterium]